MPKPTALLRALVPLSVLAAVATGAACQSPSASQPPGKSIPSPVRTPVPPPHKKYTTPITRLLDNATYQTTRTRFYDPAYVRLAYPNGDVPIKRGVCTDVVIRALRAAGTDLQKNVHEDMRRNFRAYPAKWGLKRPDPNIDHRRVPNLQTYFKRHGKALPVTDRVADYRPGDIVSWRLPNGLDHIGIVADGAVPGEVRHPVIHNIGRGAAEEDVLFAWKITGHYRYFAR